jgi:hypothetical protein
MTMASLWQTPQASTLIRTWARPVSGIGRSTISKFPPGLLTCTAFIGLVLRNSRYDDESGSSCSGYRL